jgi:hypothetical protein
MIRAALTIMIGTISGAAGGLLIYWLLTAR